MNKKTTLSTIACCIGLSICCQSYAFPTEVQAETGGVPGQVDNIYDEPDGIGIGDATMVLKHYTMTMAGMKGPINDIVMQTGADVNGDDIIDISDATDILRYYAANMAGLDVNPSDYFNVYNVYEDAWNAYRNITADFLESCNKSGLDPAYDIVYIDDNMIPELILSPSTTHADGGCTIYTYLNGKAVLLGENCFGEFGEIKYMPGQSIIINDMAYTGLRSISVKELERGKLTEIMSGTINYLTGECTLNGTSSTEAAIETALEPFKDCNTKGRSHTDLSYLFE